MYLYLSLNISETILPLNMSGSTFVSQTSKITIFLYR